MSNGYGGESGMGDDTLNPGSGDEPMGTGDDSGTAEEWPEGWPPPMDEGS